ncbi:S8 family serine peptidase [Bdellovibrio sp. HCB274]|uniref:S8/S53 family peptidase n=1 Tax=Bdellovibrio sp. HCB274 TaxID=3394361 RepID=UPI0039B548E2
MKNLRLILTFLTVLSTSWVHAFVELETRQVLDVEGGKLSPFWAQEYVGADLVKEDLRKIPGLSPVPFSILDNGFEKAHINVTRDIQVDGEADRGRRLTANHGTNVANIINGPGMISMSELVDYVQLRKVYPGAFYINAVDEIHKLATPPQVISNSMGWPDERLTRLAEEMDAKGIIWVFAAGNDHPEPVDDFERTSAVISVGSYSPRGLQTIYSQESTELDILAPADDYQASINGRGELGLFGATSGATPMVSGTVANLKALLPTLNRADAELLLKRTALRSFHQLYSKSNKAGLLNSYKAVQVAIRIRQVCETDADCVRKEIGNRANYAFLPIALNPTVYNVCKDASLKLPKEDMQTLRKNFFLNSKDARFAKMLSCAYRNEGYSINSDYYDTLSLIQTNPSAVQKKIQNQAVAAVAHDYTNSPALRDLELLDGSFKEALLKAAASGTGMPRYNIELYLKRLEKVHPIQIP